VIALSCCALFGWLIRFVPPPRLKAFGFAAEMSPWLLYVLFQFGGNRRSVVHIPDWVPRSGVPLLILIAVVSVVAVVMLVFGIRSLSGDYLVRVTAIARGRSGKKSNTSRSRLSGVVADWCGGPAARAGFEYLSRMMRRDWQFRRQMIPLIPIVVMSAIGAFHDFRISPFAGKFTAIHLLPHAFGFAFYMVCSVIVFGNDHQGTWLFLLAPAGAFRGFVRGMYARLFTVIAAAHLALLVVLGWYWGIGDAVLFVAYSVAAAALYLGLELRLIEGMPFSKQPETTQNPYALPVVLLGGVAIAIAVALQFLIFHSRAAAAGAAVALAAAAWFVTRSSLAALEVTIRFHLGLLTTESKGLYTEINA
jgi:hypothetical protein